MKAQDYTISTLGDSMLLLQYSTSIEAETNQTILHHFDIIRRAALPFIRDLIPAYNSLAISFDPVVFKKKNASKELARIIKKLFRHAIEINPPVARKIRVPVCYAEAFSPDLQLIADYSGLTVPEVIRVHGSRPYRVFMIGFLPGFAYMGSVSKHIAMPRKETPRKHIAAGSVGIAGYQTGIYPLDSPGGWQIIGRTPITLFKPSSGDPVFFQPGDEVTFYQINEDEYSNFEAGYP